MQQPATEPSSNSALGRVGNWLRSPWLAPLNDLDTIDELIAPFAGRFALSRLLARVDAVIDETADTKTFVLVPNHHWRGFEAGQHVAISIEIDGRRYRRSYSLSSDPADRRRIAITVKRHVGGRVSQALHERLQVGDVVSLSQAEGEFLLPKAPSPRLLLIGAGSGVTPLRAMLHALQRYGQAGDIRFVHVSRSPEDAIFAADLQQLAAAWPALDMVWHYTGRSGRPQIDDLTAQVPDYRERHTLLCGPLRFMQPIREHWAAQGLESRLSTEHYGVFAEARPGEQPRQISATASELRFEAAAGESLLAAAERAGLNPDYGCRKGICHSCRYVKNGITRNLLTGEVCSESGVLVQLCVHGAESDLQLQL